MPNYSICFVSSEVVPFAKTGGLADVSGALPKYVAAADHDVRVVMPYYSSIDAGKFGIALVPGLENIPVRFGSEVITFSVAASTLPDSEVPVYLIVCPRFYERGSVYTNDKDEYLRFALLSRATLELCQRLGWSPNVIHCQDWQTALIPFLLKTQYSWDRNMFGRTRTVLTIHNIGYQGVFPASVVQSLGLGEYSALLHQGDLNSGMVNYLKTGLLYADIITTVSRTYAREIQTAEYGSGLQSLLRARADALVGIVNGVDYNEWSPENDVHIPQHYTPEDLSGKDVCKRALLANLNLTYDPAAPVLGIVSRLTGQKGFDLFPDVLPNILNRYNVRMAILGSGESAYERFFERIQQRYRGKVCFYRGFNTPLAHMIEAGSDIFVMPSHYEPCGLNQIYSLKYGTIPVVRKTGGLADTVQQYNPVTGEGTGFVFEQYTGQGLAWALESAIRVFADKAHWGRLMQNAMAKNYSWEVQSKEYLRVYAALAGG